jgi:hypothetical protein
MKKLIVTMAAILMASSAYAQGTGSGTTSPGASKYAPGQQMKDPTKPSTGPGASEYAPGHQTNTAVGPGHSESAPGQQPRTTTGSNTGRR